MEGGEQPYNVERSADNDLVKSFVEVGRKLDVRRGHWPSIFIRREKSARLRAERREETIVDIVWYRLWSVMANGSLMVAVSARRKNAEQN